MNLDDTNESDLRNKFVEIYNQEKEKEKKQKQKEYMKKYLRRSDVKEKLKLKRLNQNMKKKFKNIGIGDPHKVCKKLGKSLVYHRVDSSYFYRCFNCNVSFSEKMKPLFYNSKNCPCCHLKLRIRMPTYQKKKLNSTLTQNTEP